MYVDMEVREALDDPRHTRHHIRHRSNNPPSSRQYSTSAPWYKQKLQCRLKLYLYN